MIMFLILRKIGELKEIMEMCGFNQIRFIEWIKTNPQPILNKLSDKLSEVALLGVKGLKPLMVGMIMVCIMIGLYNDKVCIMIRNI